MMEQHHATTELSQLPTEIESPEGKLVYLSLEATDGATADDLCQLLSMKKLAILSVCNSLSSQGHVEKRGAEYVPRN